LGAHPYFWKHPYSFRWVLFDASTISGLVLFFVDEAILPIPATAVAGAKETVSTDFDESNRLYFEELLAVIFW